MEESSKKTNEKSSTEINREVSKTIQITNAEQKNKLIDIDNHLAAEGTIKSAKDVNKWINELVKEAETKPGRAWWGGSKSASKGMAGIKNACKELNWDKLSPKLENNELKLRDVLALGALLKRIEFAASLTKRGRTKTPDFEKSLKESLDVCEKELDVMQKKIDVYTSSRTCSIIYLQSRLRRFLAKNKVQKAKTRDINKEVSDIQNSADTNIENSREISIGEKGKIRKEVGQIITDS